LEHACAGRGFDERRDAATIAVLKASGIRLSELAGIRHDPRDPRREDLDLWQREITVRGKGGRPRVVKISYDAAKALDRYLRARARHPQAWRPQLWLGAGSRGPMTASGIYQAVTLRGRQCGVEVWPHRFRHHSSHTWLDRGGSEGDLMERASHCGYRDRVRLILSRDKDDSRLAWAELLRPDRRVVGHRSLELSMVEVRHMQ
jgi:site-specific recombinase XerD